MKCKICGHLINELGYCDKCGYVHKKQYLCIIKYNDMKTFNKIKWLNVLIATVIILLIAYGVFVLKLALEGYLN